MELHYIIFSNFYIYIRPYDIVLGGLRFYRDSSSFFCFRQLPSELAERNSTKAGHMLGSECELKMHVRNVGYTNREPKTTF